VPDGDHVKVIARRLGEDDPSLQPGPFLLASGGVVGSHDGFARYTVGQRRGLPGGFSEPMFVLDIDPDQRAVVIGPRQALLGKTVFAGELNWLGAPLTQGDVVFGQIRHRSPATPAIVIAASEQRLELAFSSPVSAISPGQSLVLYRDSQVIGGGVIDRSPRSLPVAAA
jgi:tRNA-specific 2-thiouridylase